jgi:DNA-binding NarL/FixJ family response regulator
MERARVARELHDGTIQSLVGVEMEVNVLRRRAEQQKLPIASDLTRVQGLLRSEVLELRDMVSDIVRHLRERTAAAARHRLSPAERLTPREREIVAAVAAGESNRDVAKRLSLAEGTVKHHISNVFDKLGVSNRAELAAYAASHGLAEPHKKNDTAS